jgi:hypothetical protein
VLHRCTERALLTGPSLASTRASSCRAQRRAERAFLPKAPNCATTTVTALPALASALLKEPAVSNSLPPRMHEQAHSPHTLCCMYA